MADQDPLDALAQESIANLPEPSDTVALPEPEPFDPAKHAVDPDGAPIRNKDGSLRKRSGGERWRKGVTDPAAPAVDPAIERQATARLASGLWFSCLSVLCDPDDAVPAAGEADAVASAFDQYFAATNFVAVPAWAVLAAVLGGTVVGRIQAPRTQAKFGRIAAKLRKPKRQEPAMVDFAEAA